MSIRLDLTDCQQTGCAAEAARPALCGATSLANRLARLAASAAIAVSLTCSRSYQTAVADTPPPAPSIRWNASAVRVELAGLPPSVLAALSEAKLDAKQWSAVLAVSVDDSPPARAMFGAYSVDGNVVTFVPRFPLRPGVDYRAVFDPARLPGHRAEGGDKLEITFALPAVAATTPPIVEAVFPSGNPLPMNLLKFYIYFSSPMERGDSYRHVRVVDSDGREAPDVFLKLGEELWDPRGQRLTLLLDPGRIKRGLKPNEDMGAPLRPESTYTLVIDPEWRDAQGQPLSTDFRKLFRTTVADYEQPRPQKWKILPPSADSRSALVIYFDEALDRGLLDHLLQIRDAAGQAVAGKVVVDENEKRWGFIPEEPWHAGEYQLHVDADLEDRAGNSVGRPFERANADPDAPIPPVSDVDLPFTVAAPADAADP